MRNTQFLINCYTVDFAGLGPLDSDLLRDNVLHIRPKREIREGKFTLDERSVVHCVLMNCEIQPGRESQAP